MLSLHTNIGAMHTYRYLQNNGKSMSKSMEKLSSGYRINNADDGPADLVISEKLRSQIEGLERAIQNTTETRNLLSITEGALGEVQNILRNMRNLAIGAANTGIINSEQIAADQAQMDAALHAIDRILGTTNYAGRKLLDNLNLGSPQTSSSDESNAGLQAGNIVATPDTMAKDAFDNLLDAATPQPTINTEPQIDENGNLVGGDKTFAVLGQDPAADPLATFTFAEGTSLSDVIAALKNYPIPDAEQTDPNAEYQPRDYRTGDDINMIGLDIAALTHLQGLSDDDAGAFLAAHMRNFSPRRELTGEIGVLNPTQGKKLSELDQQLLEFSDKLVGMNSGGLGGVAVTKRYSADGPEETRTLYLADLFGGGAASLAKDPDAAMKIIGQAIKDVAGMRAEIGAIQANRLLAEENVMRTELENLTKAESFIRDTDFASEMMEFTRTQIYSQVGTQMLAAANQQGNQILNLLA